MVGSIPTQQAAEPQDQPAAGHSSHRTATSTGASPAAQSQSLRPGDPGYNPEAEEAAGLASAARADESIQSGGVSQLGSSVAVPPQQNQLGRFPSHLSGSSQFRAGILGRYRNAMEGAGLTEVIAPSKGRKRVNAPYRPKPVMTNDQRELNEKLLASAPQLRF